MGAGWLDFAQGKGGEGADLTQSVQVVEGGRVQSRPLMVTWHCCATACKAVLCHSLQRRSKHISSCNYNLIAQSNIDSIKTQKDKMLTRRGS